MFLILLNPIVETIALLLQYNLVRVAVEFLKGEMRGVFLFVDIFQTGPYDVPPCVEIVIVVINFTL